MTEFEKVLMDREGLSAEEANIELQNATESAIEILSSGDCFGAYDEIEDMLAMDYGLEMDYIFDLLI